MWNLVWFEDKSPKLFCVVFIVVVVFDESSLWEVDSSSRGERAERVSCTYAQARELRILAKFTSHTCCLQTYAEHEVVVHTKYKLPKSTLGCKALTLSIAVGSH